MSFGPYIQQFEYDAESVSLKAVAVNRTDKYYSAMHGSQDHEEVAAAVFEEGALLYRNPDQGQVGLQEGSGLDVIACAETLYEASTCLALQPPLSPPPASRGDSYKLLQQAGSLSS